MWLVRSNGTVSELGAATATTKATTPATKIVATASTPDGGGYWEVTATGKVTVGGDAKRYGDAPLSGLVVHDVVGIAATADGKGYWLADAKGGILAFGDAVAYGSMAGEALHLPIVGISATPSGNGYWLVAKDGGVFSFGDAAFHGSAVGPKSPAVHDVAALTPTADGKGYWLLRSDGAVYTYGDADFEGALTDLYHQTKFVGFTPTLDGGGYWLTSADGTVVALGDAQPLADLTAGAAGAAPAATPASDGAGYAAKAPSGPVYRATVVARGGVLDSSPAAKLTAASTSAASEPIVAVAPANRLVPASYVAWDVAAAESCPGLPWTVLAGIGSVESDFGTSTLPGVSSGANFAGAEGPMQFLADTFSAYDHPVAADRAATPAAGASPPSPYDPVDAIWAAARMLCANGAAKPGGLSKAIFAYNHSNTYVATVEALSSTYQGSGAATPTAMDAVHAALSQMGVTYVWGGETPGKAFDCSGLVQWAYRTAGVTIPRTTQSQWAALPHLDPSTPLQPGDLVYYGPDNGPTHVGMYLGDGRMVDAPHTGSVVRIDSVNFGEHYVGAIRPSALSTTVAASS